jgi:hypothetical protein
MIVGLFLAAITVAALLVWYDIRLFALYAFMVLVGLMLWGLDAPATLVEASHFSNAGKILTIARKVGVSEEDFDRTTAEIKASDPERLKALMRAFRKLR